MSTQITAVFGRTRIFDHCEFEWAEYITPSGARRVIRLGRQHCNRCTEEMRRTAAAAGVGIDLIPVDDQPTGSC